MGPLAGTTGAGLALGSGGIALTVLVVGLLVWNVFYKYVPAGKHLVIMAKNGTALDPGEVLARPGQKGIQAEVKGEGWHFIMPIAYTTSVEDNTIIPAGKVGIVTALGGRARPEGIELAEEGEQGIQRVVLPPGAYRVNKHGYQVDLVDAVDIKPGYVGVVRRLLRSQTSGLFGEDGRQRGYLPKPLQPGLYYLNTKAYEVLKAEVGIFQTPFHAADKNHAEDTSISFPCKGGFNISMDCTAEWEVLPQHMPAIVAEYGTAQQVEKKVIDVQAHAIARDKGIDYSVQDLLEGSKREKFQEDFTQELTRVCAVKKVTVHSAFIRRIDIPDEYLKPIRDKQIAAETELTTKAMEKTAETDNEVEQAQRMIQQEMAKVEADTKLQVGKIDQEMQNVTLRTDAAVERLRAEYARKIAELDAERTLLLGTTEAQVTRLKETAKSSLYQMKMGVFENDSNAFLRYSLADSLSPNLVLRLFQSGPGTFWTNLGNKDLNLMLPVPASNTQISPITPARTADRP